jgi:hypothetical protein
MLQEGVVELVAVGRLALDAQDVAFGGVEAHPPGIRPLFELLEVLL